MSEPDHAPPSAPSLPRRYYFYPLVVVLLVGAITSFFRAGSGSAPPAPSSVSIGKDYYVTVALLELSERDPSGESWDNFSESGPDIYVEISWKGNRIYRSTTKEDTFVAKWSNAELNIRSLALNGQNASMDDIIHAARINIKPDEQLLITAFDKDVLSQTEAGTLTLTTTDLKLGDTTYEPTNSGIKRLVVRVTDMSQTLDPLG